MAKKFTADQIHTERKTDGTESTKAMLSAQAKGEKRKYTRLKNWEHKTKLVQLWLTETEYKELIALAEEREENVSQFMRKALKDRVSHLKGD